MSVWLYIKSDLTRYTERVSVAGMLEQYLKNRSFKYSFWLRMTRHTNPIFRLLAIGMHRRLSKRYLIQIPRQTQIGYGLYIGHHMCIVISPTAKLGSNVNLSQFTTIGTNHDRAAEIGDNVYIGPNVSIVEHVLIGNNVTIGAGSVVTRDIPTDATAVGVPARVISYKMPGRYISRPWQGVRVDGSTG